MSVEFLGQLKDKRKFWIECFFGKDRNSIMNQIYQMIWNAAVFKVINEARKYYPQNTSGEPEGNAMLNNFINKCFFDSQFSAIRRLTDKSSKLVDSRKGISSFGALLIDIKENLPLMTRKNIFMAENLEYDYEIIKKREDVFYNEKREKGIDTFFLPEEINSLNVKNRHEELDVLCSVQADQREQSDCIQPAVLDFLINRIDILTIDINIYVNKYVAHAATLGSREYDNAEEVTITFKQFWNAHKAICQIANFVSKYLLTGTHNTFLPVPQYNHFEYINKPMITVDGIDALRKVWDKFQKETDSWSTWDINNFKMERSGSKNI